MNTVLDRIKIWLPIAISIFSLLFGGFQYFDKRNIEKNFQEQQLRLNSADLIIDYLDADLNTVLSYNTNDFVSATISWTAFIERILEVEDLILQHSMALSEIAHLHSENKLKNSKYKLQISFLLIRNTGRSNATGVSLTYSKTQKNLKLGTIEPTKGILIPIGLWVSSKNKPYIMPIQPSLLEYIDSSTGRSLSNKIRSKRDSPRLIAPSIWMMAGEG